MALRKRPGPRAVRLRGLWTRDVDLGGELGWGWILLYGYYGVLVGR